MRIKGVKYLDGYRLEILFNDKKTKIVNLSSLVNKGGYFEPLKDLDFFKKVSLDDKEYPLSICWPNGADICPDVLYEMGVEIKKHPKRFLSKRRSKPTISPLKSSC